MNLYQQYLTEDVKRFVFNTIPAHFPDWLSETSRKNAVHTLWIRRILGEPAEDIIKQYKECLKHHPVSNAPDFGLLAFLSALSGKDAPLYLIDWQPNRLISGSYSFQNREAIIKIIANVPGTVRFKSYSVPANICDNDIKLPEAKYDYNEKKNILVVHILEKGEHIIKIKY